MEQSNCPPSKETSEAFKDHSLEIRLAADEDLKQMKRLMMHIYSQDGEGLSPHLEDWYRTHPEAFEEEFYGPKGQDPGKKVFYVVEDPSEKIFDQSIVGCGGIIQHDPEEEPDLGEMVDVYLHRDIRGEGLGSALVNELIDQAKSMGFNSILLFVMPEFETAKNLYQELGFKEKNYPEQESERWVAYEKEI